MPAQIGLSIVLPLFRTAAVLPELHRRLTAALQAAGVEYELIYVDDACPEGSGGIVRALAAGDPRVALLTHERNQGQQRTVLAGLRHSAGDRVVIMDADLQDPPEQIEVLLAALDRLSVEAVFAGRRGQFQPASRMITSRAFKYLMHLLLAVPADAGSFVLMTRRMADAVLEIRTRSPYMLALIGGTGLPVRSVPLPRAVRAAGESAYSEWGRIRFAYAALGAGMEVRWIRYLDRLRLTINGSATTTHVGCIETSRPERPPTSTGI